MRKATGVGKLPAVVTKDDWEAVHRVQHVRAEWQGNAKDERTYTMRICCASL